ncbi:glutaminyl-peptide cyclotransferase [Prochlorothrix hollandica]|uniref:glutaminyl-peptide cyclotransferase n=1 Tax=Prochlorothrix hollandica TaxID=1223 RepID=UPI0033425FE9
MVLEQGDCGAELGKQRRSPARWPSLWHTVAVVGLWTMTSACVAAPVPISPSSLPVDNTAAPAPSLQSGAAAKPTTIADPNPDPNPDPDPDPDLDPNPGPVTVYGYRVLNTYPHDPQAFTQGLLFHDGRLYEGTGLWGRSSLRAVDLETGNVQQQHNLEQRYFGEGLTLWQDRLIQLTWRSRIGFVYDRATFTLLQTFTYPTEGWGLTHDGQRLILSDGSDRLSVLDPETFQVLGQIPVREGTTPIPRLNELEYIKGEIWANIWLDHRIARIDPQTGQVVAWVNLAGLEPAVQDNPDAVLNGIAYDAEGDRLFVTGKLWTHLFEIDLVPPP